MGLAPPPNGDRRPLPPDSRVGRRLALLTGMSPDEYDAAFDRVNLHRGDLGHSSSDEDQADRLAPRLVGRRVVFLGRRVAAAFGHGKDWYQWHLDRGRVAMVVPHPSGRSRVWNDVDNWNAASEVLHDLSRPCVHVEGPDGAGKTTLAGKLAAALGLETTDTHGPVMAEEGWWRLDARLSPRRVADRSFPISELVYGPILRGTTQAPEKRLWSAVRAMRHVVTFVYCRPPTELIVKNGQRGREDEDPRFVGFLRAHLVEIVDAYDRTMEHVSRLGCRVIEYDWTHDPTEGVVEAICAE